MPLPNDLHPILRTCWLEDIVPVCKKVWQSEGTQRWHNKTDAKDVISKALQAMYPYKISNLEINFVYFQAMQYVDDLEKSLNS